MRIAIIAACAGAFALAMTHSAQATYGGASTSAVHSINQAGPAPSQGIEKWARGPTGRNGRPAGCKGTRKGCG
jgi:hypothetical protein